MCSINDFLLKKICVLTDVLEVEVLQSFQEMSRLGSVISFGRTRHILFVGLFPEFLKNVFFFFFFQVIDL